MDPAAAAAAIVMLDTHGLVHTDRPDLPDDQRRFAVSPARLLEVGLRPAQFADPVAIARATRATVLIGATACAGAFSEALVREVALHHPEPIVLPLSNPGSCVEASPEDILAWTDGRALVAAGGPSRDVVGPRGTRVIGQANNVFVFPGVGLGAILAEAREVTDAMFLVAAHELAGLVSVDRLRTGALYPPIKGLRDVARAIAVAVAREARDSGLGRDRSDPEIDAAVDAAMWWPDYVPYLPSRDRRSRHD
jgi:malate dehydrogenase (oxaloacetate-decarboxylating)